MSIAGMTGRGVGVSSGSGNADNAWPTSQAFSTRAQRALRTCRSKNQRAFANRKDGVIHKGIGDCGDSSNLGTVDSCQFNATSETVVVLLPTGGSGPS
jgi:hypothetical protein